jgi:hypothetical protein
VAVVNGGRAFPDAPRGWYLAGASGVADSRAVVRRQLAGIEVAIGRGQDGAPTACGRSGPVPVAERDGAIFVFPGDGAPPPLPTFQNSVPLVARVGRTIRLDCHWASVVANGFDVQHLGVVHRRALVAPPEVVRTGDDRLRLTYESRVTGRTASDRIMHRLSGGTIRASIECWSGTTVVVESEVGRRRAAMMLCLDPAGGAVAVTPIVAVPAGRLGGFRSRLAAWLYRAFLERDVVLLDGMRFRPAPELPEDEVLATCLDFLAGLPECVDRRTDVAVHAEHRGLDVAEALAAGGGRE